MKPIHLAVSSTVLMVAGLALSVLIGEPAALLVSMLGGGSGGAAYLCIAQLVKEWREGA